MYGPNDLHARPVQDPLAGLDVIDTDPAFVRFFEHVDPNGVAITVSGWRAFGSAFAAASALSAENSALKLGFSVYPGLKLGRIPIDLACNALVHLRSKAGGRPISWFEPSRRSSFVCECLDILVPRADILKLLLGQRGQLHAPELGRYVTLKHIRRKR